MSPCKIYNEPADEDLVRSVLAGAKKDFRILIQRHQTMVYSMVMRQTGDIELSRGISQETFIRAFRSLHTFKFKSKFSSWLVAIALNQTRSYYSSRRYRELQKEVEYNPELLTNLIDNNDEAIRKESLLKQLQEALGNLKPIYREAIILCFLEGKSYQDAAEILDIPPGTVGSRLNKGVQNLREIFHEGNQ